MGIRKQLNETSVQDDIECEYCGYPMAMEEEESRGDLQPAKFKYDGGYHVVRSCPVCGWLEYEDYRYYDDDEEEEGGPPDPLIEYEPSKEQAVKASQIVKFVDKIVSYDDIYDHVIEYIWSQHNPDTDDIVRLKYGLIPWIFHQRR